MFNEKSSIIISAYNSTKQLIETTKELKSPIWIEDSGDSAGSTNSVKTKNEGFKVFWGYSWHMQTPLDNLEIGSFITVEYRAPPIVAQSAVSANSVSGMLELNISNLDSGHQFLLLSDINKQGNQVFINNDRSMLSIDLLINQRNRVVDYRTIYGM